MSPDAILEFWFSDESRARWFDSTPEFDQRVRKCFFEDWQCATRGATADWTCSPRGALALVILFDQFPLHMFRGHPEAYSTEPQARTVAREAIASGMDLRVVPGQRGFFYLPFMHSESLADQDYAVSLYSAAGLEDGLRWAQHHRELIRRFGRFPHRNAVLGRESTTEELAYLRSPQAFQG